jgi:hypothetical protein
MAYCIIVPKKMQDLSAISRVSKNFWLSQKFLDTLEIAALNYLDLS